MKVSVGTWKSGLYFVGSPLIVEPDSSSIELHNNNYYIITAFCELI
jgi:hypothetical protein